MSTCSSRWGCTKPAAVDVQLQLGLSVGDRKLQLPTRIDGGDDGVGHRVDDSQLAGVAVNDENMPTGRIVRNAIGIVIRLEYLARLERAQVEGGGRTSAPVVGIAAP